jgi:hypothetical protein
MLATLNKLIPVLPLIGQVVDKLCPFMVGRRTAVAVAGQALVVLVRAFGVEVPHEVDLALEAAAVSFAAASLGRKPAE